MESAVPDDGLAERVDGDSLLAALDVDDDEIRWRKEFTGFGPEDAARLTDMADLFESVADEAVDEFYDHLTDYDETTAVLNRSTRTVDQLKETQSEYLLSLATGEYDREYFENRARIGKIHDMLDMPMKHYLGAYGLYWNALVPRIGERVVERTAERVDDEAAAVVREEFSEGIEEILALLRVVNLDMQVVSDTYIESYNEEVRETNDRLVDLQEAISEDVEDSLDDLSNSAEDVAESADQIHDLTREQASD